jgi:rifampicin phosphotransferase
VPAPLLHLLGGGATGSCAAIGGKAASLDRLCRLGLPTPPGFCLTVAAHALYLSENGLHGSVGELQRRLPEESARATLAELMFSAPLPVPLRACLGRGLHSLAACWDPAAQLAVRSSATLEDGLAVSFAGQHETVLGVDAADVEQALRRCWASLWSRRSVAYRCERSIPFEGELMGVVVQPVLAADASAVVFTRNPLGSEEEVAVSTVRGVGEPLVSGAADASTIVVDRPTLEVLSVEGPAEGAVDRAAIRRLVELCLRVERDMGVPADIEAALVGEHWWLLQARPITTVSAI